MTNAACAVGGLLALRDAGVACDDAAIRTGLERVRWPGRLEWIPARANRPAFLLDAAHNTDGCASLASEIRRRAPAGPVVLVFGAMRDKDHAEIAWSATFDALANRRVSS